MMVVPIYKKMMVTRTDTHANSTCLLRQVEGEVHDDGRPHLQNNDVNEFTDTHANSTCLLRQVKGRSML